MAERKAPDANEPQTHGKRDARREDDKIRVPAEPIEQRPGEAPIGNGGTDEPAAYPPHN
jgi:hypothetical protein